jgi:hypothetical protein
MLIDRQLTVRQGMAQINLPEMPGLAVAVQKLLCIYVSCLQWDIKCSQLPTGDLQDACCDQC